MSVDLAVGDALITSFLGTSAHYAWSDAVKNVTHSASDPTNPRRDIVVAYIDYSVVSSASSNNPNALKFKSVAGTPAGSPVDPSDPTIQTSVGAGNPFLKLARVAVAASASTIVNANITDLRTTSSYSGGLGANAVTTTSITDGAATARKIKPAYAFTALSASFSGAANTTEQTVTGLTTTITDPGVNGVCFASATMSAFVSNSGTTTFRLYINGVKVNEAYSPISNNNEIITISGIGTTTTGSNISVTITVQNDASSPPIVNGTNNRSTLAAFAWAQ